MHYAQVNKDGKDLKDGSCFDYELFLSIFDYELHELYELVPVVFP